MRKDEKRVVVTGASGHVGMSLVEELLKDQSLQIRALYRKNLEPLQKLIRRLKAQGAVRTEDESRLELVPCDLVEGEEQALQKAVGDSDAVVHLAAEICIHQDARRLEQMRRVNLQGTRNILEASYRAGIRNFIQVSSIHAFRHLSDQPLSCKNGLVEAGELNYDSTKAESQKMVVEFGKEHSDFYSVIVAPSGVIGRNDHSATEMWPVFERSAWVRFGPIPNGGYAFVDVRQVSRILMQSLQMLFDPSLREKIKGQEFIVAGQVVRMPEFLQTLQSVTDQSHCLNLWGRNRPSVVPLALLASVAPWCEQISKWMGKKSLITTYGMKVLGSLPHGVASSEFEKLEEFFGESSRPFSLEETFQDRYQIQEEDEKLAEPLDRPMSTLAVEA